MIFKYKELLYFSLLLLICLFISSCDGITGYKDPISTTTKNEFPLIERNGDWLRINNHWYNYYNIIEVKLDPRGQINMEIGRQYNSDVTIFIGDIKDCEIVFDMLTKALVGGT